MLDVITDFKSYPEWAEDVKSVSVLAEDESGLGGDVRFRAAAMGQALPIHSGTTTEVILSELHGDKLRETLQKKLKVSMNLYLLTTERKQKLLPPSSRSCDPNSRKLLSEELNHELFVALEALSARIDSVATA